MEYADYFDPDFTPDTTPVVVPIFLDTVTVPQHELVDIVIEVTAASQDMSTHAVLAPEIGSKSEQAHQLILAQLGRTGISMRGVAAELGYRSESEARAGVKSATEAVKTSEALSEASELIAARFRDRLLKPQASVGHVSVKEAARQPDRTVPQSPESQASSPLERRLIACAQQGDKDALAILERAHEGIILEAAESLGAYGPDGVFEHCWRVYDRLLQSFDTRSPDSFRAMLSTEMKKSAQEFYEQHCVEARIEKSNLAEYYNELTTYVDKYNNVRSKGLLASKDIERVLAVADEYVTERFQSKDHPLQGMVRLRTSVRKIVMHNIRTKHEAAVRTYLKGSSRMARDVAVGYDFHLGQFNDTQLHRFLALSLQQVAATELAGSRSADLS